jgi:hypothetical protein
MGPHTTYRCGSRVSFPTVAGQAVEGTPYREAQSCLGPAFAGSSYRFFLTGTLTPANVYQNGILTTPFPSPVGRVTSNSFGRFPAIYLDPSVTYRVQFYDNTNTLRWQVDPYISQLSTVGTSSLSAFGFQIAPTGEITLDAPNTGGTGVTLTLKSGSLGSAALRIIGTLPGNSALIVNSSATTGAQTATFVATNKPGTQASSPAGWLPITCDGVQYYTPVWHGNPFTPYASSPSAFGEVIVGNSATFTGTGLTTVVSGTATPSNWFAPTQINVGAGYYINITKTGGLSGLAFSAAQGSWVNITGSGLTISSNAQAPITGTYQLSTSISGSPIVAAGTITLSGNGGVQQPTYNGATPLNLAGNGTATLNGVADSNWFTPTTTNIGSGFYVSVTQTGGSSGASFIGLSGVTNITNSGLSIGVTGPGGTTYNASGTYSISSDAAGLVVLGSGTVTLTGGSLVQSPNWSGTAPLNLAGDGSATLNSAGTSSWYSPNASNVGSGYWINITRTGGTTGVNFSAAQGSWTNITNSGLAIGMTGTSGVVGTATASGTYQISSSSSGSPLLGSGTISLSLSSLTTSNTYTSGSGTETVPPGASNVVIQAISGGGSGSAGANANGGAGGAGAVAGGSWDSGLSLLPVTAGQTFAYAVGAGGAAVSSGAGNAGGASTVSGTVNNGTISITCNGGQAGNVNAGNSATSASVTGTAPGATHAFTSQGSPGRGGSGSNNVAAGGAANGGTGNVTGGGVGWTTISGSNTYATPDTTVVNAGNGHPSAGAGSTSGGAGCGNTSGTSFSGAAGSIRFFYS